jgi:hypothetical protein
MLEQMQIRIKPENISEIKARLRRFKKKDIEYNEPHFTLKLDRQKIDRKEVIKNLLNPEKLAFVGVSESKNPKSLYLINVIKIRRKIQDEAIKYYEK